MAKQPAKKGRGRPTASKPKSIQIAFRIDELTATALEAKRVDMNVLSFSLSDTVREVLLRTLKAERLL